MKSYLNGLYRAVEIMLGQSKLCRIKGYPREAEILEAATKTILFEADSEVTEVRFMDFIPENSD